jgi:hypothetical protein
MSKMRRLPIHSLSLGSEVFAASMWTGITRTRVLTESAAFALGLRHSPLAPRWGGYEKRWFTTLG